jgi:ATP-dependent RNA helicase DDX52/ROK1
MDSFSVLKDGTSFDRKRFGKDMALFSESLPIKKAKIEAPKTENIRKEFKISVSGTNVPEPVSSWTDLFSKYEFNSNTKLLIRKLYENMTPIQMQGIPSILNKRDLIGIAPTGSGKTLAFSLPMISLLKSSANLRALVLSPTKELSRQLFKEFLVLSEGTGLKVEVLTKKTKPAEEIVDKCDILVSTPLLMVHWLGEDRLTTIQYIIMDEADQLFDMGYLDQIDTILKHCPGNSMKLMFSATILPSIEILAYSMLIDPIKIIIGMKNSTVPTVSQDLKFCTNEAGKILGLRQMIQSGEITPPVLVFIQSKDRAIQLSKELKPYGLHVGMMHSGLNDKDRDIVVKNFRTGQSWILICTDLMSRGMDFHGVNLVINYDFPQSVISYIHRIGRAGRAGEQARAVTFYTIEDAPYIKMIANVMKKSGFDVPDWIMKLKNPTQKLKKKIERKPIKRENIGSKYRISRTLRRYLKTKVKKENITQ